MGTYFYGIFSHINMNVQTWLYSEHSGRKFKIHLKVHNYEWSVAIVQDLIHIIEEIWMVTDHWSANLNANDMRK